MWKEVLISTLIVLLTCRGGLADEARKPKDYKTFSIYTENDIVAGTDLQYTNGIKLTWTSEDLSNYRENKNIPEWSYSIIEKLPFINKPGYQKNVSFSIGQNMYTPDDQDRANLIKDDRPYAGLLYVSIGFTSKNTESMHTMEIIGGIVGPHSYADKTQDAFHSWFGAKKSYGWDNQLKDEPILNLYFERKWRVLSFDLGNGYGYDLIPHAGFTFGNLVIAGTVGGQFRYGLNLPKDFGMPLIRPGADTNSPVDEKDPRFSPEPRRLSLHMFLGVDAVVVGRNILLDGNTFTESHNVDKRPVVGRFFAGFGILFHKVKFTYSNVWETKEFETQKAGQQYGSITISYSY